MDPKNHLKNKLHQKNLLNKAAYGYSRFTNFQFCLLFSFYNKLLKSARAHLKKFALAESDRQKN
jgi:hypothetical protein